MDQPGETIPVLLDTDIGSNIDDAVALAYLLTQPRCELVGITTVTGEPHVRAQLADAVCRAFGRSDVTIHCGAARPLIVPQAQPDAPQKAVLTAHPHREDFAPDAAVEFLRGTIRSRPGEIALLSIGPLTNVGLLFATDPEIPFLLRQHVMMGGVYFKSVEGFGPCETNVTLDPHAAAIVFNMPLAACPPVPTTAGLYHLRCFGLDVTTRCGVLEDDFRSRFQRGALKIIGDMAETWRNRRRPQVFLHDVLAAAAVFEPSLCTYETGRIEVELHHEPFIGQTVPRKDTSTRLHEVAVEVDSEAFFLHCADILGDP